MARLPTIRVKADTPSGFKIINERDFDEAAHDLYDEVKPAREITDRDVLEARAEELGIGFNSRTKDKTLRDRIAEAEAD